MKIRIFDSREECLNAGAMAFIKYALANPAGTIGCCTGTTTEPIYEMVSEIYKKNPFDASRLNTVNADEYLTPKGYDKEPLNMRCDMQKVLWDALGIEGERANMPDCNPADWEAAAVRYEKRVMELQVGLQMLGVGKDAHLGFCLPGTPFQSVSHVTALSEELTRELVEDMGVDPKWGPFYGITMGLKTFMMGKAVLPIVSGSHKAEAAMNAILGPVTEAVPASILQLHPDCTWLLDKEAAEGIIGRITPDGVRIK